MSEKELREIALQIYLVLLKGVERNSTPQGIAGEAWRRARLFAEMEIRTK